MRPVVIVVVAPCRNQMAGMAQGWEQVLVQALVPQTAVEAFHEAVLHRLARRDVVPFDLAVLLPFEHGVRRQLGAVVADHHAGMLAHLGDPVQFAGDTVSRQRRVNHGRQAFSPEVVDHAEDKQVAPVAYETQAE